MLFTAVPSRHMYSGWKDKCAARVLALTQQLTRINPMATTDLAATYAALILADADAEITAEKILALTTAANIELEPIWATLLSKALEGKNVKELLSIVGVASGPGPAATAQNGADANKGEEAKPPDADAADTDDDSDNDSVGLFDGGLFD
ncbi:60S acidic ribosomal protein [Mycena kentingensis (nom. inval.)]|nr:60S acidic ribosomal protein [Mycena kentingensis (nom. inval.)]